MKKGSKTVNFDMSKLNLSELVKVYEEIISFLEFLAEKEITETEELSNE